MKSDVFLALENAGWPVLLVAAASTDCRPNQAAVRLFGSVLEGTSPNLSAIWSPENNCTVAQFLAQWERAPSATSQLKFRAKGGGTLTRPVTICTWAKDGEKFFILQFNPDAAASSSPPSVASEETGFFHKQKLDCALQLARTVALDFNNALTSILGHTSHLLSKIELNHPWRPVLLEVEKSAARAAEIASDLGTFSRQEKEARGQTAGNLNSVLQRCVEFFQQNAGELQIQWNLQFERKLFAAKFDEAKMQQAFMKIIENALQASKTGGRVTIQTRNLELEAATLDGNVELMAGAYVCVETSDTGSGIEPEVLPRIFEPFFTTKRGHRGLGLAWVYGIVTNHGGGVAVTSHVGVGTSVRVYLPAEKRIVRDKGLPAENLTGRETILVVDDEDMLLTMSQTILSAYGYRVLTAGSGQKALEILSQPDTPVDLVMTDLVMPSMSGRELVEHIRQRRPDTRILCTSGYVWPGGQEKESDYLKKPFTAQELLLKVKQTLA